MKRFTRLVLNCWSCVQRQLAEGKGPVTNIVCGLPAADLFLITNLLCLVLHCLSEWRWPSWALLPHIRAGLPIVDYILDYREMIKKQQKWYREHRFNKLMKQGDACTADPEVQLSLQQVYYWAAQLCSKSHSNSDNTVGMKKKGFLYACYTKRIDSFSVAVLVFWQPVRQLFKYLNSSCIWLDVATFPLTIFQLRDIRRWMANRATYWVTFVQCMASFRWFNPAHPVLRLNSQEVHYYF